ncbi:MAG TPA: serine hydrolase [Acidobacteria bacterium]|nr:serine hydrolase [Acidobacteriota bacterium]
MYRWLTALLVVTSLLISSEGDCLTASEQLDRALPRVMRSQKTPGLSAAVVRGGKVVWAKAYGFADVAHRVPTTTDTAFMLASVSKTVTATAMMQLVEDGRVGLDAPIDPYLPFTVRNPRFPKIPITVRMLLTHTSSIADGPHSEDNYVQGDAAISLESFLAGYFTPGGPSYHPENFLDAEPGEAYEYSNEGTALIGLLVQRIAGRSFESFCADRIFKPLGMTNTSWRLAGLNLSKVALPYSYDPSTRSYDSYGHYGYPDIPNGALRTTAPQLAKFLLMFMNRGVYNGTRVLKAATVDAMRTPQVPDLEPGQGLIWFSTELAGRELIGHDGSDDGVSTAMFYEPATGIGVIVLANGDGEGAEKALTRILPLAPSL